jgi:hypothetical protein
MGDSDHNILPYLERLARIMADLSRGVGPNHYPAPKLLADLKDLMEKTMPLNSTTPLSEARDDLLEMIAHEVAGICMDDEGMGAKDIYAAIAKFRSARKKEINDA